MNINSLPYINRRTPQQKTLILVLFIVILFVMVYKLAFSVTLGLLQENEVLNSKLVSLKTNENDRRSISLNQIRFYNAISKDSINFYKSDLFKKLQIAVTKYNTTILSYNSVDSYKVKDYEINTQKVILDGDYTSLMKVLDNMESQKIMHKLNSISFKKTRNPRDKSKHLILELIYQIITHP